MTHPVNGRHINPISDRMGSLNGFPGLLMDVPIPALFGWMPANSRRIKDDSGSLEGHQTGSLREPLVPTNQYPDLSEASNKRVKALISWSKIELLIIQGVVRNMHLSVGSEQGAICVENHCRVVIYPAVPPFKQRCH